MDKTSYLLVMDGIFIIVSNVFLLHFCTYEDFLYSLMIQKIASLDTPKKKKRRRRKKLKQPCCCYCC